MGHLHVKKLDRPKDKALYIHHLIQDLEVFDSMLQEGRFEKLPIRIGAEQEFCLVDDHFYPGKNSIEILEAINDSDFTTEIGKYNLELNSSPLKLTGNCFSQLHQEIKEKLLIAKQIAAEYHTKIILTGILPTLRLKHISEKYMTDKPRYHVLNQALKSSRQQDFHIHIKGVDELNLLNDSVMLEACNTSFQTHLQIDPDNFIDQYNWAQTIAGPVLSSCVNSPMLFGRELWSETRIALFTQSIDTRSNSFIHNEKEARVSFGYDWEKGKVSDIFKDNIARFRSLLSSDELEDSKALLASGKTPHLRALSLHNGTVYKWNRVCYGVGNNKPHLRIECRYIPAGPTLSDEIATMMLWVGLMLAQKDGFQDISERLHFKDVKANFFKAARHGMESQFIWFGKCVSAKELLTETLIPLARKALVEAHIDHAEVDHYLGIVQSRINGINGSEWMIKSYRNLLADQTNFEALQNITDHIEEHQLEDDSVAFWKILHPHHEKRPHERRIVKHNMKTRILLVDEEDSLELVYHLMQWKNIHHLPVINRKKELCGMLSWTDLMNRDDDQMNIPVKDVMSTNIITISQEKPLKTAVDLMKLHNINCLPVTRRKELLGILTSNDLK
jgi:CBS domain-containing protein/gamma-glutamyl:cysteine ligase YbdK (ATP-grasp superfamily)